MVPSSMTAVDAGSPWPQPFHVEPWRQQSARAVGCPTVEFGESLHQHCAKVAATLTVPGGLRLTCATVPVQLRSSRADTLPSNTRRTGPRRATPRPAGRFRTAPSCRSRRLQAPPPRGLRRTARSAASQPPVRSRVRSDSRRVRTSSTYVSPDGTVTNAGNTSGSTAAISRRRTPPPAQGSRS